MQCSHGEGPTVYIIGLGVDFSALSFFVDKKEPHFSKRHLRGENHFVHHRGKFTSDVLSIPLSSTV
jgi:hypothetical protein